MKLVAPFVAGAVFAIALMLSCNTSSMGNADASPNDCPKWRAKSYYVNTGGPVDMTLDPGFEPFAAVTVSTTQPNTVAYQVFTRGCAP